MAERTRQVTAALTATLGGLAAPSAAHAMLPPDAGGGPAPAPPKENTKKPKEPAADPSPPVRRDPTPPAPTPVVRREAPVVPAQDPVQRRQPVKRQQPAQAPTPVRRPQPEPPAREPQDLRSPDAVTPVRRTDPPQPEPPARRPQDLRSPDAVTPVRRTEPTPAPTPSGDDQVGPRRAQTEALRREDQHQKQGREREQPPAQTPTPVREPQQQPAATTEPKRTTNAPPPAQDRPAPAAAPRPEADPEPRRATEEQVQSDAERYANALDQIDADDGALRGGTAQAMRLGDDPRVVTRAKQIREREADALEQQQERQRQEDRKAAEDARVLSQGRAYMNAQDRIRDNGGALNMGLSRALSYGDDPKVKGFVTEYQRRLDQHEQEARQQERREQTRRKAETYLNTLDQIESNGGALNMGLSRNLQLGQDPDVKKTADRIAARRDAADERRELLDRARTYLDGDPEAAPPKDPAVRQAVKELEQKRQTRSDAERYANALDRIDDNGGALNMGLSQTLQQFADNNKVRRLAEQMRAERANEYKEDVFGPMDGPSLRDPTLGIAIPYPGHSGTSVGLSLEQECMLQNTPNAALACAQGPKKPPVAVKMTGKVTGEVSRGNPELSDSGKTYETLSLSVDMQAGVQGDGKLPKGVGITLSKYDGKTYTYKLRVTSERAEQIADGTVRPPNPIDPDSLRAGESITMDKESYEGNSQSASYKILKGTLGFQDGRRLSSAVERLPNGRMRILVGDEEFVKNAIELRLGTDDFGVAAGVSKEFAYGDLRTVEVNPRNEPGWDAYQHFVTTGTLPATEGRGVRNTTSVEKASWSSSTTLKLDVKPIHVGGSSTPFAGDVTETRHSDGSTDYALTDRHGSVTYIEQAKKELGDEDYGPSEYSLLLQGADSSLAEALTELHGGDVEAIDGDNQNLRLRFTEADLDQLRKDAVEQISYYSTEASEDDGMTPAEVEEEAKKGYYDAQFGVPGGSYETYLRGLATARNPSELLAFVQNSSFGNSSSVVDDLLRLQMPSIGEDGRPEPRTGSLPGSVDVYAD